MKLYLILFSVLFSTAITAQKRIVAKSFANGSPYVVVYVDEDKNIVKEEIFYENGQLESVGNRKGEFEHGDWIYYWSNGNLKYKEYYEEGLEQGVHYDYNENGKIIKVYQYKDGILISKKTVAPTKMGT